VVINFHFSRGISIVTFHKTGSHRSIMRVCDASGFPNFLVTVNLLLLFAEGRFFKIPGDFETMVIFELEAVGSKHFLRAKFSKDNCVSLFDQGFI